MRNRTVAVVGTGIQGRAAIQDLEQSDDVARVVAADIDVASLTRHLAAIRARKTEAIAVDAGDRNAVAGLLATGIDVAISFVPARIEPVVAVAAIDAGVNVVTTNYAHALRPLHDRAVEAGVTVMPEAGFDPGIDLVIARHAVAQFERVDTLNSYGSGIPAPECRDANVLNYKISWSFDGVLATYARPARVIVKGAERVAGATEIFRPEWRHAVTVGDVGALEAFVNGDAADVIAQLGVRPDIENAGRYTLRWPGHCDFWERIVGLGLLDDEPDASSQVSPREFLRRQLEPRLQYGPSERDMVILRVDAAGVSGGRRHARRYELIAYRDLHTGLLAMSRVVGTPASIVAQMILRGQLARPGIGSPIMDLPPIPFFAELSRRGINVTDREIDPGECYVPRP